jgi:hypothetical protein
VFAEYAVAICAGYSIWEIHAEAKPALRKWFDVRFPESRCPARGDRDTFVYFLEDILFGYIDREIAARFPCKYSVACLADDRSLPLDLSGSLGRSSFDCAKLI